MAVVISFLHCDPKLDTNGLRLGTQGPAHYLFGVQEVNDETVCESQIQLTDQRVSSSIKYSVATERWEGRLLETVSFPITTPTPSFKIGGGFCCSFFCLPTWLHWVSAAAHRIFSCRVQDVVP